MLTSLDEPQTRANAGRTLQVPRCAGDSPNHSSACGYVLLFAVVPMLAGCGGPQGSFEDVNVTIDGAPMELGVAELGGILKYCAEECSQLRKFLFKQKVSLPGCRAFELELQSIGIRKLEVGAHTLDVTTTFDGFRQNFNYGTNHMSELGFAVLSDDCRPEAAWEAGSLPQQRIIGVIDVKEKTDLRWSADFDFDVEGDVPRTVVDGSIDIQFRYIIEG